MKTYKKKILLIDDNEDLTDVLSYGLKINGFEVEVQNDSRLAIHSAKSFNPDLVILDMNMPCMDGGDVLATFKNHDQLRDIPVIFLTGLATQQDLDVHDPQMDEIILAKPIRISALTKYIHQRRGTELPLAAAS